MSALTVLVVDDEPMLRRLRRKIEVDPDNPRWITTVRGVGYRFEP